MRIISLVLMLSSLGLPSAVSSAVSSSSERSCTLGPVTKHYGGSAWLVYGCDDGKSVVLVFAPGSAAFPFVFIIANGPKGMDIRGEGDGKNQSAQAAFKELSALALADIASLYKEASTHSKASTK
jgi:hypothetical protein